MQQANGQIRPWTPQLLNLQPIQTSIPQLPSLPAAQTYSGQLHIQVN
jgi:hypothetical protein